MLNLKATDLLAKRKNLLEGVFKVDYETIALKISDYFNDEHNLLSTNPSIELTTDYTFTKEKLVAELRMNGFFVEELQGNTFKVLLPLSEDTLEIKEQVVQEKEIPIILEEVKVVTEPIKVVVEQPSYSHTDLQMLSGNSPF